MKTMFFLGLDLGQANDWTALAIVQPHQRPPLKDWIPPSRWYGKKPQPPPECVAPPIEFHLRHLERLKREMPYPDQVRYVLERLRSPALAGLSELVVDATGVGRPVVDLFREKRVKRLTPITITGGLKVSHDDEGWHVPKRDLVILTQVLLQQGRLKIADRIPLKEKFKQELMAFKVKIDPLTANDSYGAGREGAHDDIVLAVTLAVWRAAKMCGALDLQIGGFPQSGRRFATPKSDADGDMVGR